MIFFRKGLIKMDLVEQQEIPRSLVDMVTAKLREKIEALPIGLLDKPEHEIILEIRKTSPDWTPSATDFGIRLKFWREYTYALQNNIQMRMPNIYNGVCAEQNFFKLIHDQRRLAYMLCEFQEELEKRKLGLSLLWNEMIKLINKEIKYDLKTGLPDSKTMGQKLDLFKFLYAYQHGQPIQKIQQETKNLNYNIESTSATPPTDMAQIDARIAELRAKELAINSQEVTTLLPTQKVLSEAGKIEHEEFKR